MSVWSFNPCFLRPFCNKPFLMWGSTPRPRKPCKGLKKSFTKRTLFLLRKEYLSGEGIGNPNLFFFGSNLFLKGLMFQNLLSKERSFTKKGLFLLRKNGGRVLILVLLGGEGIGNPNLFFARTCFLRSKPRKHF